MGFHFWDPQTNHFELINHPEKGKHGARFNDGRIDRKGRFWAGTMTAEGATSSLYRLDPDLTVHRMETGITISNGLGWSLDGHLMYFTDSLRRTIFVYDFDLESGDISNKREFYQLSDEPGVPDGLSIDREGFIWSAIYNGWKLIRIDPQGNLISTIQMPVSRPSSCAFGGTDFNDLYITTISEGLSEGEKKQEPLAGDLFVVEMEVAGFPESVFSG